MTYEVYESYKYKQITIHKDTCTQLEESEEKQQEEANGKYTRFTSFSEAQTFARATGLPIFYCSRCSP
jgi:hypothetical protein